MKRFPYTFNNDERIIRHVYSPQNINPNTRTLKSNWLQFRFNPETSKNELSCIRFEFTSLKKIRELGKIHARPPKADYYGFACTNALYIREQEDYNLKFTPLLEIRPRNYFHCDIYDNGNPPVQKGQAAPAHVNLQRENFLKKWDAYFDDENLIMKELVEAP